MTEDKFELIYQHKAQVYRHILYLLEDREGAEDVPQSTAR